MSSLFRIHVASADFSLFSPDSLLKAAKVAGKPLLIAAPMVR